MIRTSANLIERTKNQAAIAALVQTLKDGDQTAFLPLYQKTAPGLLRFLLWKTRGDLPLSEDILQESYVRFFLNLDRIEATEGMAVQSYLLRIVKNCLIDKTARSPRHAKAHVPLDFVSEKADSYAFSQESMSPQERAIEMRELSVAMGKLDERESEIIFLRDAMGLSHREVADQVGMTEQASRQAYVRAKRSLLSLMSDGSQALFASGSSAGEGSYATNH